MIRLIKDEWSIVRQDFHIRHWVEEETETPGCRASSKGKSSHVKECRLKDMC